MASRLLGITTRLPYYTGMVLRSVQTSKASTVQSNRLRLPVAASALAMSVFLSAAMAEEHEGHKLDLKTQLLNNYENRIRKLSTPEKVFETFASIRKDGHWFMTPSDFMRSITPNTRALGKGIGGTGREFSAIQHAGHMPDAQIPKFFQLFDVDGDGLISFSEYLFFITLLSIPDNHLKIAFKMFDVDGSGQVDRDEFKAMMTVMRNKTAQGKQQRSAGIEDGGLVSLFFGKDGHGRLTYDEFEKFMRALRREVLHLEFDHFDIENKGHLTLHEFGQALISNADVDIETYLQRCDRLLNTPGKITFDQYYDYHEFLKQLDSVETAMETYTATNATFTKETFSRVARAVTNVHISHSMTEVIFQVFDSDGDGHLQPEEYLRIMRKKSKNEVLLGNRDTGFVRMFSCLKDCTGL
eukprot:TRINITY_DN1326_c0_g1::TRINITY_DN1326_c0_g1_i1::g.20121::m.20121 TRINITY_DN1326_c0_g1::TRINITY_DN1326_c0_g1_i1::g.20121  ORF type:complete len:412 (-),score=97.12,sp/Q9SZ45/MICU_ARATH/37.50/3e-70,EF-hand_1/PF00036.27/2.1e-05,EF-hand_1/PF00036.27/1.3e-08,EF-hand_1/PF00036.27/0.059,EF-hand_1/PF00036.27/0.035,EF-hand_1/PF00036.27/1.9e+03,EF-hand_1/PF00036.27/2.5e-05,EF-hand_7/PF13499.1/1.5e-06,EF-hand_7/PF13499.1/5.5e-08,EF-hand_7/PF13499.1/0.00053,EF-hand_7/PF13499.1/0.15,EF-hand_7/PF13499.1/0.001,